MKENLALITPRVYIFDSTTTRSRHHHGLHIRQSRRRLAASPENELLPLSPNLETSPTPAYRYSINPCFEANVAGSESNAVTSENGIPFSLLEPFWGNSPVAFLITAFPASAKICKIRGI